MNKNKNKGFTLIELMIVIGIIGILTSIAMPSYQDYIAKAQISEAMKLLDGAHAIIEEDTYQTGSFPADVPALEDLGIRTTGNYGNITTTAGATPATGVITYSFTSGNRQLVIDTKNTVSFTRDSDGFWVCHATLPRKLVPKNCSTP